MHHCLSLICFIHPQGFVVEDQRGVCICVPEAVCAVTIIVRAIVIFRDYLQRKHIVAYFG